MRLSIPVASALLAARANAQGVQVTDVAWSADDGSTNRDGGAMNQPFGAFNGGNQYVRYSTGDCRSFTTDITLAAASDIVGVSITVGPSPDTEGEGYSGLEISTSTDGSTFTSQYRHFQMFGNYERDHRTEYTTLADGWTINTPFIHRFDNVAAGVTNVRLKMWQADIRGDNAISFNAVTVDPVGTYPLGVGDAIEHMSCTDVNTPYVGCIVPNCTAIDIPYVGCAVQDCTAVDTPYVNCSVPDCSDVDTPYAGCIVPNCTAIDTPYAGCAAQDCTASDTPYSGCTAQDCTDADTPYAGCTALDCTTGTDTPYTGCIVAPCTDNDTPYAGCVSTDCAGSWSACTTECESAGDRTWDETTAQIGTGTACPAATDCAPGVGACPATTPPPATSSSVVAVSTMVATTVTMIALY